MVPEVVIKLKIRKANLQGISKEILMLLNENLYNIHNTPGLLVLNLI